MVRETIATYQISARVKRVAVIGTQGVPARYGGFESLIENIIGDHQSPDVHYTIFCSSTLMDPSMPRYKGADLKYVPLNAHGARSVPYDIMSMLKSLRGYDTILILGVSGCTFLPILKHLTKARIIVNIDGHEYRRHKWGSVARNFLRLSESMAVKHADIVVTDNKGIMDYVQKTYGRKVELIAYGGDQVMRPVPFEFQKTIIEKYGLDVHGYALSICRIEPENNCHLILQAFRNTGNKLVFIGNWGHSDYSQALYNEYHEMPNILLLDATYDLDILFSLRNNSRCYIHGHSAGGTNPSLVEAMFFGRPILAYDVVYNRETTFNKAIYFNDSKELERLLDSELPAADILAQKANENYNWSLIARMYEALY